MPSLGLGNGPGDPAGPFARGGRSPRRSPRGRTPAWNRHRPLQASTLPPLEQVSRRSDLVIKALIVPRQYRRLALTVPAGDRLFLPGSADPK